MDTLRVRNGSGTGSMGRDYGSENGARHRAHGRARFTRTTRDNGGEDRTRRRGAGYKYTPAGSKGWRGDSSTI